MAKKTFEEKLNDSRDMPKLIELDDPKQIKQYGGKIMLIAPPLAYDAIMKKVPAGKLITSDFIRNYLAKAHGADFTCPLTAGIFMNIAAGAAGERTLEAGRRRNAVRLRLQSGLCRFIARDWICRGRRAGTARSRLLHQGR